MEDREFYFREEQDGRNGITFITLGCGNNDNPEMNQEVTIVPERGSNMCRYRIGGKYNIIDYDAGELFAYDFTGNPVLYPTPGRVRDCTYTFEGQNVKQTKRGRDIFLNGLVYDEKWQYSVPEVNHDNVTLETWIDIDGESPVFEGFPYANRLSLEFRLTNAGVTISYKVENRANRRMPFGFALHPHFRKLSSEEDILITVPANYVMEATPDLLPTGRLLWAEGTGYDLTKPVSIDGLNLDNVYTGIERGRDALVEYKTLGLRIRLKATAEFNHMAVCIPPKKDYFCLDNRTCSADAHNLYDKGFIRESGLIVLEPEQVYEGSVSYIPEYLY